MAGRQGTTSAGAGAVKLRFCPESNDLLYPKEDKENKRLVYFCKTCNYMEPADDPCISRNLVEHTQMEKTVIKADVRADPSLPRTREQLCPKCENREAVFFCTATNEGMTLFYQCMTCGFRWQDENSASLDAMEEREEEVYVCNAAQALKIRLISNEKELDGTCAPHMEFHPEFTHQVFGEDEAVHGYEDLEIIMWMHKRSFHTFVEVNFSRKRAVGGRKPDDIDDLLNGWMPQGFYKSKSEFGRIIREAGSLHLPQGEFAERQSAKGRELTMSVLPLGDDRVRHWFQRVEVLNILFIDGARMLEDADSRWEIIATFVEEDDGPALGGYATVYNFFAWPDKRRLRIAQLAVLPPYRRLGIATALLEKARQVAIEREYVDLTVEDPSDEMQKLRDVADVSKLLSGSVDGVRKSARQCVDDALRGESLSEQVKALKLSREVIDAARHHLAISPKQMERCWEALLYAEAKEKGEQTAMKAYSAFKELIRRRLQGGSTEAGKEEAKKKHLLDTDNGFVMTQNRGLVGMILEQMNVRAVEFDPEAESEADENAKRQLEQEAKAGIEHAVQVASKAASRLQTTRD